MIRHGALTDRLNPVVTVLESHFEEIITAYIEQLIAIESPLVAEAKTREQVMIQAQLVLKEVTIVLRGREVPPDMQQSTAHLFETIGVPKANGNVHAFHFLRALGIFSEAVLSVVTDNLPPSPTSRSETAAVALAIQDIFMERVMKAAIAYANYLLEKAHESHADERRRISRELHDRVDHSMMVAFRSLELYEVYRGKDPSKAQAKLERAKSTMHEALELTRSLSKELRATLAEEGLEATLSELVSISVPQGIRSWVSVKGDESLIAPQVVCDELFLILREGVRNVVTHSGASTMSVEVNITKTQVKAVVEDDGQGFEPGAEATGGTGLASMKERTSLLGGNLNLASEPGKGTRTEILLPLLPRGQR